jgi:hypothetical protein
MSAGSDENSMKRSNRGQKPRYTLLAVYCLGELYVNELRRLGKKREIVGFTQTMVHDCFTQFVNIKNLDIIKAAIYDAIAHGWAASRKARERGRDLFTPTKSGLVLYTILDEVLFNAELLALYLENPGKVRKEIERLVATLVLILDGMVSQLNLYKIIAKTGATPPGYQKIPNRLSLLEEVRDAVKGYNREIPKNIEAIRLYNIVKYLLGVLRKMEVIGTAALCDAANRIIDSADPVTWNENVLG